MTADVTSRPENSPKAAAMGAESASAAAHIPSAAANGTSAAAHIASGSENAQRQVQPRFTRLRLAHFRNHPHADWHFSGRLVAFCGANGVGKTNLLEALSLFSPGRGLRRAPLVTLAAKPSIGSPPPAAGPAPARLTPTEPPDRQATLSVLGDLETATGPRLLATALLPGEAQRQCRIDRAAVSSANAFMDHARILWLTPDQDGLFRGSAGERRRFLDRLVLALDSAHGGRVSAFENAQRHRNRLLEDYGTDPRWLDSIEAQIVELGVAVSAARCEAVLRLGALSGASAPFPPAILALEGALEARLAQDPAPKVEDWYRQTLADNRARDRAAGRALSGPQNADLVVIHGPKGEAAGLCSTGEQKALLLGLILAQAQLIHQMRGQMPILLLDEVAAHLDETRRAGLFDLLATLGGQVFMTGTDAVLFAHLPASGEIIPLGAALDPE